MAYEIQVSRVNRTPITEAEWRAFVVSSPAFEVEEEVMTTLPNGQILRMGSPGGARWTGGATPKHISWRRGSLRLGRPDAEAFVILAELARVFGAQVVGEEGELYDEQGKVRG